jgi:hypothetical protein
MPYYGGTTPPNQEQSVELKELIEAARVELFPIERLVLERLLMGQREDVLFAEPVKRFVRSRRFRQ